MPRFDYRGAFVKPRAQVKGTEGRNRHGRTKLSKKPRTLLGISDLRITPHVMTDQRLEHAVQRIERALARIAAVADTSAAKGADPKSALAQQHEALRSTVRAELDKLDHVIGELEK